jgi:hypothetical protein
VAQAGIDKLPPPITPENNPHTVPGQFDLNGNDQRGHIIAAGAEPFRRTVQPLISQHTLNFQWPQP